MVPFDIEMNLGERLDIKIEKKRAGWFRRRVEQKVIVTDLDSGVSYTLNTDEPLEVEWTNTKENIS